MAFRGREFMLYWIAVEEQISTQARKAKWSQRNCLFVKLALSPALLVCLIKAFFLQKLGRPWNATQKSGNASLDSQSGGAHGQALKSWNTSHKHELCVGRMDSDRSRSGFLAADVQGQSLAVLQEQYLCKDEGQLCQSICTNEKLCFSLLLFIIAGRKNTPNQPKTGFPMKEF